MGYFGWSEWDFDDERDPKNYKVWLFDGKDSIPVDKPFDLWRFIAVATSSAMQYAPNMLSLPTTKGWDWRLKDAFSYFTIIEPTEDERRQREHIFREKIAPWIDDVEREWRGKIVPELVEYFEQLKKADVEKLNDIELREHFDDWMHTSDIMWKKGHFLPFFAIFQIYLLFEELCKELLGIDEIHPQFKALVSGFDNRLYRTDRELWRLSDRTRGLGLEQTFQAIADDEQLLSQLGESEAGRKWLQELDELLSEDGWRCAGHPATVSNPTWVEKPSLAVPHIRQAMAAGGVFVLDRARESLVMEREEVEKDILSRVPADKREWFEKLMRAAQWQGRWSEEHQYYDENYFNALGRRVTKEIGKRFAQAGTIEDPEDIYFLLPQEIRMRIIGKDKFDALKLVRIRKEQYEEYKKAEPPAPFIGDPGEVPRLFTIDPILRVPGTAPIVKPELKADLYSTATAPGVAEGIARVIFSEDEFPQVQPGDILVTATTSPAWTPLFGIVKAVVTDYGGSMTHAVVVGREYGIPVACGTLEATRKIKTGQRVKVDGDMGAVYILG